MRALVVGLMLVATCCSDGKAQTSASESFDLLSQRLEEAQHALEPPPPGSMTGEFRLDQPLPQAGGVAKAVKIMEQLSADFRTNPWVRLKGFKISLGLPPRLDVDFEFPPVTAATPPR